MGRQFIGKPGPKVAPVTRIHADEYTDSTVPPMPATADYSLSRWDTESADFMPVDEWPGVCVRAWRLIWTSPVRGKLVEADTLQAEMAVYHLAQSVDMSLKEGERLKHAAAYEKGLAALGLTPDSRNRLKITVAQADEAEARRNRRAGATETAETATGDGKARDHEREIAELYARHTGTEDWTGW